MFAKEIRQAISSPNKIRKALRTLTDKETQVLSLLIQGHNNKQIAEEMDYNNVRSVDFHISSIKDKLRCGTRDQLLLCAAVGTFCKATKKKS